MNKYLFKKKIFLFLITALVAFPAQTQNKRVAKMPRELNRARQMIVEKNYVPAANLLFNLSYGNVGRLNLSQKLFAKYLLGYALFQSGYYQLAAFPLISVINDRSNESIQNKSLQIILKITDKIKDVSILNYAIEHLSPSNRSGLSKTYISQKLGDYYLLKNDLQSAESQYKNVLEQRKDDKYALYQLGLISLKKASPSQAFKYFEQLYQIYKDQPGFSTNKGLATLAIARTYYQGKKWDEAIEFYKKIPRNHSLYRETQMELSWAQFRDYKFRAALGTIESLQTPFYETYYDPESLMLRIIIQMFICQVEDMDKSLSAFEKTYIELKKPFDSWYGISRSDDEYLNLINATAKNLKLIQNGYQPTFSKTIPFFVARRGLAEPKVSMFYNAVKDSINEHKKFKGSPLMGNRNFAKFAEKAYKARIGAGQKRLIAEFKNYLDFVKGDIKDFTAQFELTKYEAINTKKQVLRAKTYVEKDDAVASNVNKERNFYLENGFRFWPYQGEFWVDEIGSYQYLGTNRCVNE